MKTPLAALLVALVIPVIAPAAASAQVAASCTTSWVEAVDGEWTDAERWSDGVPVDTSVVCITVDGTYVVDSGRSNFVIAGLELGGSSGTQTLASLNVFNISGDGHVGPTGRWEVHNRVPGGTDGLYMGGTLLVEGVLWQEGGTVMLDGGGVVEIAESGRWILSNADPGIVSRPGTFILRGTLEGNCPSQCQINLPLNSDGGTLQVSAGELRVYGGHLHDTTVDVPEGTVLNFYESATDSLEITGTLSGEPQGSVIMSGVGTLYAGPGDATFAIHGTGLTISGSGPNQSWLRSSGGKFVNTGLLNWVSWSSAYGVVIENHAQFNAHTSVPLSEGAILRNLPGATVAIVGSSSGFSAANGRFENYGLLLRDDGSGTASLGGVLRSQPGSEIRSNVDRLNLGAPAVFTIPANVTLSGTGTFGSPSDLEYEGIISPGTEEVPMARLSLLSNYFVSQTSGNPQLHIDIGADGQSDTLFVHHRSGPGFQIRLGGALILRVQPDYTPQLGDEFTVVLTERAMTGAYSQVVTDGAPEGIAFVAELAEDAMSVKVRAVEAAPGGPITVSTTTPVAGGIRTIFLSGPGAEGVTAARLDCVACLDEENFGSIAGELFAEGTVRTVLFDLTPPRAFGTYDLVLTQPSLPDTSIAVTVRPFMGFVHTDGGLQRGGRVRPPGHGYNYTHYRMITLTNTDAPVFSIPRVFRQDSTKFALALATGSPFSTGKVLFETDDAADPSRAPIMFGRVSREGATNLTYGLRINPEYVLFPEQEPTGPDDDRIPFGDLRGFLVQGPQHFTQARVLGVIRTAIENSDSALADYVAAAEAVQPGAVESAFNQTLASRASYFTIPADILQAMVGALNVVTPAPDGLAEAAAEAFAFALEEAAFAAYDEIEDAFAEALNASTPEIAALVQDEVDLVAPDGLPGSLSEDDAMKTGATKSAGVTQQSTIDRIFCKLLSLTESLNAVNAIGGGGGGGGGGCAPGEGPADPNDKLAESNLMCEFGTVVVDDEEYPRCVRYYLPVEELSEPLVYTIKFENLPQATAPAEFVTITDEIDANLNLGTLEIIATSSDSTFSYDVSGRMVTFRFIGINLPPNVNAPQGEGFVSFSIKPNAGLPVETEIRNKATIVFDFNPPIETPEVLHEVVNLADLASIIQAPESVVVGEQLALSVLAMNMRGNAADASVVTIRSDAPIMLAASPVGECTGVGTNVVTCDLGTLAATTGGGGIPVERINVVVEPDQPGPVLIQTEITGGIDDGFTPNNKDQAGVSVKGVGVEDEAGVTFTFELGQNSPNPAAGPTRIGYTLPTAAHVEVGVYDLLGRQITRIVEGDQRAGTHELVWTADVASGIYVYRLRAVGVDGKVYERSRKAIVVK